MGSAFCALLCAAMASSVAAADTGAFETVTIRTGARAGSVEKKCAVLLRERLTELGSATVRVESETGASAPEGLLVLLGVPDNHDELAAWFDEHRIQPLTWLDPGVEGFLVRAGLSAGTPALCAAGIDQRGVLYAVGEILRQVDIGEKAIHVPAGLNVRTAPAFEVRGTQFGQSSVAIKKGKARPWTEEETQRVILDYALAGANVFSVSHGAMFDFIKSWGLMTQGSFGANTGSGPPEWQAEESIGRTGYLCLSVPEARQKQIERCEAAFKDGPAFDFVKFHGGDGGGCECDKCDPYGLTFIKTVEEMAKRIHKYHPETRIYFTNQKFDNADDNAIFEYLQEEPRDWLWAWGYGPGSDAMSWQPGHRQTHRMDLFRYPGFGPFDRYNKEILHQLPPRHVLVYYNEITHWRYSQHGYIQMYPRADKNGDLPPPWNHFIYERQPDQALTMVYDRLTWYAWPRFYHWVFGEIVRYGVGDITHSSGHHDHFNQWMWQRLLWAPQTSVEDVVDEYCTVHFGTGAAPLMAEALFLLEEYLEEDRDTPITGKTAIDRYYELVKEAGRRMPANLMDQDWVWRMHMQKAATDKYVKLNVGQQVAFQEQVEQKTAQLLENGASDEALDSLLDTFQPIPETSEMTALREEAVKTGEESNGIFGMRSEGLFNLEHDYTGLGWLERQVQRARESEGAERAELLRMIVAYEDPGPGGYYDNCGTANPAPNVVQGYPYDHGQPYVPPMLSEANRPSQRTMHFTQDEAQGVTFHYRDLDPEAQYKIRFTFVRPWFQERYAFRMNQKSQSIYADDILLTREIELPLQMSDFFTFDIPREATRDGELTIRLEKAHDVATGDRVTVEQWRNSGGWGTIVSEAWLMKTQPGE